MSDAYARKALHPRTVLGYRKDGRAIYPIAGGSEGPGDTIVIPAPPAEEAPPVEAPAFTQADIDAAKAAARKEEKDKLYATQEALKAQNKAFETDIRALRERAEAADAAEAEKAAARDAAKQAKFEEEASAKDLLKAKDAEWAARFDALNAEREAEKQAQEADKALVAKERAFLELRDYTVRRVTEVADTIAPELLDLVTGNTPEEIDASIATLQAKSQAILETVQAAQKAARAGQRGVSPAGYGTTGPLDNDPGTKTLTLEELQKMPLAEYAKHRSALLGAAATQRNTGLYG